MATKLADAPPKGDGTLTDANIDGLSGAKILPDGRVIHRGEKLCDECKRLRRETLTATTLEYRRPHSTQPTPLRDPNTLNVIGQVEVVDRNKDIYENTTRWLVPPRCVSCRWKLMTQSIRRNPILRHPSERDLIVGEASRLELVGIDPYPSMAALLRGLAETYPLVLDDHPFPAGAASVTPNALARIGLDRAKEFIGRQQSGDFGDMGHATDAMRTDAARWAPAAYSLATQNVAARDTGEGFVWSRYQLIEPGRVPDSVGIVSVYRPGHQAETIVYSSRDTVVLAMGA